MWYFTFYSYIKLNIALGFKDLLVSIQLLVGVLYVVIYLLIMYICSRLDSMQNLLRKIL